MNKNAELLNYIHKNSQMGKESLTQLIKIVKEGTFKEILKNHLDGYTDIFRKSEDILRERNQEIKDIGIMNKISTYVMINVNTAMDQSISKISEMLIQGSTMGVTDILKKINEYDNANDDVLKLANKLLEFEEDNINTLKEFL